MAFDLDDEELKYTRRMKGLDNNDKGEKSQKSKNESRCGNGNSIRYKQRFDEKGKNS